MLIFENRARIGGRYQLSVTLEIALKLTRRFDALLSALLDHRVVNEQLHLAVGNINVYLVAVLDERDKTALRSLGRNVTYRRASRSAAEASVCDKRYRAVKTLAAGIPGPPLGPS